MDVYGWNFLTTVASQWSRANKTAELISLAFLSSRACGEKLAADYRKKSQYFDKVIGEKTLQTSSGDWQCYQHLITITVQWQDQWLAFHCSALMTRKANEKTWKMRRRGKRQARRYSPQHFVAFPFRWALSPKWISFAETGTVAFLVRFTCWRLHYTCKGRTWKWSTKCKQTSGFTSIAMANNQGQSHKTLKVTRLENGNENQWFSSSSFVANTHKRRIAQQQPTFLIHSSATHHQTQLTTTATRVERENNENWEIPTLVLTHSFIHPFIRFIVSFRFMQRYCNIALRTHLFSLPPTSTSTHLCISEQSIECHFQECFDRIPARGCSEA